MIIAVIWSRFGPYHIARLKAANEIASANGATIYGLAVADRDSDYGWDNYQADQSIPIHTLFRGQNYHALSSRSIVRAIWAALDRIRPDAVALNGWSVAEARAALRWCESTGAAAIVMSATKEDDARRQWWKEAVKRRLLCKAGAALVGGVKQKDYLIKLGMAADRILVGYDVVDNEYFMQGANNARKNQDVLREKYSLPKNYFFACTRLLPRKNVDRLLRAYAAYRAKSPSPWDLVIAGSGAELSTLQRLELSLGLEGVIWPGFVQYNELPIYYGLAKAFIHPATAEAWGLVLNEAAASGLPLIVSDRVGAHYELLRHEENGFLFDPLDIQAICGALLRLECCSPELIAKMGNCSSAIARNWGPDRFGRELIAASRLAMTR